MARNPQYGKEVELDVVQLNKKGDGVGTSEHGSVVVSTGVPGDRVRVKLGARRKRVISSEIVEVMKPSPMRVVPQCRHVGVCGGCRIQQMEYGAQLRWKEERVRGLFEPFLVGATVHPINGCEPPWDYRNKMEFTFSEDRAGHHYLGLISSVWRGKVFNLEECHLVDAWYSEVVARVREWWKETGLEAFFPPKGIGTLRTLTLRRGISTGDRLTMVTVSEPLSEAHTASLIEAIGEGSVVICTHRAVKGEVTTFTYETVAGKGYLEEELAIEGLPKLRFRIEPSAFFQPNTRQAEYLYQRALDFAALSPSSLVYDLYCGTGTMTLLAATKAHRAVGIELNGDAVRSAVENAEINGLDGASFIAGDVGKVLTEQGEGADVAIVDPPRVGLLPEALNQLVQLGAERIVYVSCNPVTQADNIAYLTQQGYRVAEVQPVDQFPHTAHVENIALLVKR